MNCFVGIATAIPGTMITKPGPSVWGNEISPSFTQGNNFTIKKFTGIFDAIQGERKLNRSLKTCVGIGRRK